MATKDDERPEQARERGKRPAAATGAEPSSAAARAADPSLTDELRQARCEYWRAVQRAWVDASQDIGKANAEFSAIQQRIALDTEVQNAAAQRAWLRTMHDARAEQTANPPEHIRAGYQGYQQAIEAAVKSGRDQWAQSQKAHQAALTAAREAYANASREALNVYLAHVKAAWNATDIAATDPATFASLAEAGGHVVNAAHALRWSERNGF